ncbi:MAG: hypothetical protein KatS3mg111_3425 [Pirellulaceae bacterium]|nr:MAG: hypothetical protein KatS3mg111_3425 [Pirellulaceae bacterium]
MGAALVRCASTGESGFITPTGKFVTRLPVQQDAHALVRVPLNRRQTIYALIGDAPLLIFCSIVVVTASLKLSLLSLPVTLMSGRSSACSEARFRSQEA